MYIIFFLIYIHNARGNFISSIHLDNRLDAALLLIPQNAKNIFIEHLENQEQLLREAHRLLTPHETIIISFPQTTNLIWKIIWSLWIKTLGKRWINDHIQ